MRHAYILDTLTSVDFQENAKSGGKMTEIYGGDIYRENFKISPSEKL